MRRQRNRTALFFDDLKLWAPIQLVTGVAADLAAPLGHFALYLLIAALVAVAAGIVLHHRGSPQGLRVAKNAGVGAAVFGLIFLAQQSGTRTPGIPERGVLATNITFVSSVQTNILPLAPEVRNLFVLQDRLGSSDPAERATAAREALQSNDGDERRKAVEIIFATRDAHLRQIAILRALRMRQGQTLPILVDTDQAQTKLSQAFIGASLHLNRVDESSSSIEGELSCQTCGWPMNGTVALNEVAISSRVVVERKQVLVSFELRPTEDFQLAGTVRGSNGDSAKIHIPLL